MAKLPAIRGRFAPSPTGSLHFGSLIAALGSFLEARSQGGEWLVRIEDVDQPRTVAGAAAAILRILERCGLDWDGPVWYQSQRTAAYQAVLDRLLNLGLAYPCTCSRRELANSPRARDGSPIYPGCCRGGVRHSDRPQALRLRVDDAPITFHDAIQGDCGQNLVSEVGDFVIRRTDGYFAYQLAVVVDDADQGITHIVRGSDLLDSTARQIYLQQLLDFPALKYAHLPIAVDQYGYKLSKQTGAEPINADHPGLALWSALRFLGQEAPPELVHALPAEIIAWALTHWRLTKVPTIAHFCAAQLD